MSPWVWRSHWSRRYVAECDWAPLPDPYGYQYSLRHLSPAILRRAAALYVWVEPEESRRRNDERARPGREGDASILHHGVPEAVMRGEYGTDDFTHGGTSWTSTEMRSRRR